MKISSRQGEFEPMGVWANEGWLSHQVRWHYRNNFSIFFNMNVCCVFSLELPHRGDSNEYTQHAIINIKKKITLNYPIIIMSAAMGFFP